MTASETDHDKRTPSRIDWVDAAKGMSILLVVLHHVVILSEPHGLVPGPVSALNTALASLRMPLFFLASGLFAAAPLAASWRTLLHKRVAFFLYLFVLWTLLQSVVFLALPADGAAAGLAGELGGRGLGGAAAGAGDVVPLRARGVLRPLGKARPAHAGVGAAGRVRRAVRGGRRRPGDVRELRLDVHGAVPVLLPARRARPRGRGDGGRAELAAAGRRGRRPVWCDGGCVGGARCPRRGRGRVRDERRRRDVRGAARRLPQPLPRCSSRWSCWAATRCRCT